MDEAGSKYRVDQKYAFAGSEQMDWLKSKNCTRRGRFTWTDKTVKCLQKQREAEGRTCVGRLGMFL